MKDLAKTAMVLVAVAFFAAVALGVVDRLTRERIKQVEIKEKIAARKKVLPAVTYRAAVEPNFKALFKKARTLAGTNQKIFPVKCRISSNYHIGYDKQGQVIGYVYNVVAPDGYNGDIKLVVGVKVVTNESYGKPLLTDYNVIKSGETPGLGKDAEVALHAFFTNKNVNRDLKSINPVDKSDAISGATITSCAIKDALYGSLLFTTALLERDAVNMNVPQRDLALVPYARKLEPVAITNSVKYLREFYEAKFFQRKMGYVFKSVFRLNGKKYLGLFGIVAASGRVFLTKLYESTFNKQRPFIAQVYDRRIYTFADQAKLEKAEPTLALDKPFVKAVLEAYQILKKRGLIK